MKLLFVTRKIDRGDPLTGFVFTWLEKLLKQISEVRVICLEKGDISGLSQNIKVYSMGKEKGKNQIWELFNYLRWLFKLIPGSEGVFIHMHPIYAVIAWLPAKLFRKKIVLWYTHKSVDFKLRVAHALVDSVLTASKESFRLPSRKVRIVGHGIDLEKFTPTSPTYAKASADRSPSIRPPKAEQTGGEREGVFRILSIGRISPVKDYETLIKAAEILRDKGVTDLQVEIYGRVGLPEHESYLNSLISFVRNAGLEDFVKFQGELDYEYVDEVYREADLFVNLSQTGSIDKSVLEAAACETLVLTSNEAFRGPLEGISPLLFFQRNNPQDLAEKILQIKALLKSVKLEIKKELRAWVEKEHNLDNLVKKIIEEFVQ